MIKKLILYGASNFGDEIVQLFRDVNKNSEKTKWEIVGFLDDNFDVIGKDRNGVKVIGNKNWLKNNHQSDYYYVCCIGNAKTKSKIVDHLNSFKVKYASAIHPTVVISEYSKVGDGTVITAGNIITTNVLIKNHIIINLSCTIGHKSVIEDYCTINPAVNISGDTILHEGAYIGTNATILEKISIGRYSIIGGGALVNKNIPDNVTAVGIPVRIVKQHSL